MTEVYQVKELLYAILMQQQANGQPVVVNRRFIERALKLGRRNCNYAVTVTDSVVRVTAIDQRQIERISGL
jgi:hypothetical protein